MSSELITPLPLRVIDRLLAKLRYPKLITGACVALPMLLVCWLADILYPENVPLWADNPLEITGTFLMFAILSAYLMICLVAQRELSISNRKYAEHSRDDGNTLRDILTRWYRWWWLAIPFGFINIFLNVGIIDLSPSSAMFSVSLGIVIGQWIMWTSVGLALFFSLHEAFILHTIGGTTPINLYDLNSLNGFGKNALSNFLMIAGALALTTLQAIDQSFEWGNYRNGLLVGIPAALIMVPLPIWQLHKRIKLEKQQVLEKIDEKIRSTSTELDSQALEEMNELLIRREQILKLRNWPMDLSIFSRFFIYGFIVPLAWAGAALMEVFLDSILGL